MEACSGEAVMMSWELPLMERHAEVICAQGGDVLNIGFGLGLIDEGESPTHNIKPNPPLPSRGL